MSIRRHPFHKRVIAGSIWAVALVAALFVLLRPDPAGGSDPGLQVGSRAPDFALNTPDGTPVKLSDFKGRPVVINFWASWCPACRQEMPDLEAAHRAARESGLVILAINLSDSSVAIEAFRERYGLTFPILVDEHSRVTRLYQVIPLPTTYFVDAQGLIRSKHAGLLRPEQLQQNLNLILGGGIRG